MPNDGGLRRQNPWWLAAMNTIMETEAALERRREERLEKMRADSSVKSNRMNVGGGSLTARPTGRTRADLEQRGVL